MKELYLKKADENFPKINEDIITPFTESKILDSGDEIVIDLGNHYVGYFSFELNSSDIYIDAPVRLCVKFCEVKRELEDDFLAYNGFLCESWLQQEIINVDFTGVYKMPRRYATRYIKIKVIATSQKIVLSNFKFVAVTSADAKQLKKCNCDKDLERIDLIAVNTLKNCMHRVFEDGPKRDRRLWIGDLRLEALTDYYTFNNLSLVRRCLYLFAASDTNDSGFVPAYVYENPKYVSGYWFLQDYALLFVISVCDYYNHTQDKDTFCELYPIIKKQMDAMHKTLDGDGIVTVARDSDVFIDWCPKLEKITSLHGVYLYTLRNLLSVLTVISHEDKDVYAKRYEEARNSAEKILYDKEKQAFLNSRDKYQYSVHSAVWMVLGGVVSSTSAEKLIHDSLNSKDSVKPFTPYMHHYVVEAMISLNLFEEAKEYIKKYWNGMVELGADTFYEVFVHENHEFSPYKDRKVNSMCHAWSCTPAYFIRKYFYNK